MLALLTPTKVYRIFYFIIFNFTNTLPNIEWNVTKQCFGQVAINVLLPYFMSVTVCTLVILWFSLQYMNILYMYTKSTLFGQMNINGVKKTFQNGHFVKNLNKKCVLCFIQN